MGHLTPKCLFMYQKCWPGALTSKKLHNWLFIHSLRLFFIFSAWRKMLFSRNTVSASLLTLHMQSGMREIEWGKTRLASECTKFKFIVEEREQSIPQVIEVWNSDTVNISLGRVFWLIITIWCSQHLTASWEILKASKQSSVCSESSYHKLTNICRL